jgi:hypothetical protein
MCATNFAMGLSFESVVEGPAFVNGGQQMIDLGTLEGHLTFWVDQCW